MSTMGKEGALRFLLLHTRYQNSAALKIRLLRYEFCRLEKSQHWVTLFSGRDLRAETRVLARAVHLSEALVLLHVPWFVAEFSSLWL